MHIIKANYYFQCINGRTEKEKVGIFKVKNGKIGVFLSKKTARLMVKVIGLLFNDATEIEIDTMYDEIRRSQLPEFNMVEEPMKESDLINVLNEANVINEVEYTNPEYGKKLRELYGIETKIKQYN